MFHLFSNLVLDFVEQITDTNECIILSQKEMVHPFHLENDLIADTVPVAEKIITDKYEGNWELFWKTFLELGRKKEYFIYVDEYYFYKIVTTYWKSIFLKTTPDFLYQLISWHIAGFEIKSKLFDSYLGNTLKEGRKPFTEISFSEYTEIYHATMPSEAMRAEPKSNLGFSYLILNYLHDSNFKYKDITLNYLKQISAKNLFDDLDEIKFEILKKLVQVNKVIEGAEYSQLTELGSYQFLKNYDELRWIISEGYVHRDINILLSEFKGEMFVNLRRKMDLLFYGVDEPLLAQDIEAVNSSCVSLLFSEEDFVEQLIKNLDQGIGLSYLYNMTVDLTNQVFISKILERVKARDWNFLQMMTLE